MNDLGIEIVSDQGRGVVRARTRLSSLDWALRNRRTGELGGPLRTIWEIYGKEHVGKSTLADYISAAVQPDEGHILIMNVDEAAPDENYAAYIASLAGFTGTIEFISHVTSKGKPRTHDEMLDELVMKLHEEGTAGMLDSVGAYYTTAQSESDLGEGFGGAKRAGVLGDACSRILSSLRNSEDDKIFTFINHQREAVGSRGHRTPGGQRIKDAAAVRLRIWRKKHYKYDDNILGYRADGKVVKNRYGGKGNQFRLFFLEGRGLHLGMTAVMDADLFGLADLDTTVKLNGESMGYIKADLITAAIEGNDEVFEPFIQSLEEYLEESG